MNAAAPTLSELRARVDQMQGRPAAQPVATHPAFAGLLQLQAGSSYSVDSMSLAMALMAGPVGRRCVVRRRGHRPSWGWRRRRPPGSSCGARSWCPIRASRGSRSRRRWSTCWASWCCAHRRTSHAKDVSRIERPAAPARQHPDRLRRLAAQRCAAEPARGRVGGRRPGPRPSAGPSGHGRGAARHRAGRGADGCGCPTPTRSSAGSSPSPRGCGACPDGPHDGAVGARLADRGGRRARRRSRPRC